MNEDVLLHHTTDTSWIERELCQPLPRAIRRRPGHGWFIGCFHFFVLPHCLVGIVMTAIAVKETVLLCLIARQGINVPGQITETHGEHGRKSSSYRVQYSYRVGSEQYADQTSVDETVFPLLSKGKGVEVRILPQLPTSKPQLQVPGQRPWAEVGSLWLWLLFWDAAVSVIIWMLYVRPLVRRSLVRWGLPTRGVISGKHAGGKGRYYVDSHYRVPGAGHDPSPPTMRKATMDVRCQDYNAASIGDLVTVLYHPRRPRWSVIYPYADYEACRR